MTQVGIHILVPVLVAPCNLTDSDAIPGHWDENKITSRHLIEKSTPIADENWKGSRTSIRLALTYRLGDLAVTRSVGEIADLVTANRDDIRIQKASLYRLVLPGAHTPQHR